MTFVRPRTSQSPYAALYADDYAAAFDETPGERIGVPFRRRGRLAKVVIASVFIGSGWFFATHTDARTILADAATFLAATTAQDKIAPGPTDVAPKAAAVVTPPAPPPIAEREIKDAPGAETGTVIQQEPAAAAPVEDVEPAAEADDTPKEPLPTPTFDAKDPLKKRAVIAGLHPDISQSLLKRMSATDFKNAGVAVQKALKETPDGATLTWPSARDAKLALFEIKFVRGAEKCRRYVVIITKDRWSTTSQPMEKCGINAPGGRVKAALSLTSYPRS